MVFLISKNQYASRKGGLTRNEEPHRLFYVRYRKNEEPHRSHQWAYKIPRPPPAWLEVYYETVDVASLKEEMGKR